MSTTKTLPSYTATEEALFRVLLPDETKTYKPISHKQLIDKMMETLDLAGYTITERLYQTVEEGNRFSAIYKCLVPSSNGTTHRRRIVMFQNSYNKKWAIKLAFGSEIDGSIIVDREVSFKRKHTGTVEAELNDVCHLSVFHLSNEASSPELKKAILSTIVVGEKFAASILGDIFVTTDILNTPETSKMKKALQEHFKEEEDELISMWDFYKSLEKIMRASSSAQQIKNYLACMDFFTFKFGLY